MAANDKVTQRLVESVLEIIWLKKICFHLSSTPTIFESRTVKTAALLEYLQLMSTASL